MSFSVSYKIEFGNFARKRIRSWNLPDTILVEVHLRLREELAQSPTMHLVRRDRPFDGMVYAFSLVDPERRLCEHTFAFKVVYSQDEEYLIISNGAYLRRDGW
jgi:hypothetical protein